MQEGDKTARVLMQSCSDSTSAASSILVECKVPIRAFAVTLIWPDNYCVISQVCEARENQTRGAGGGSKKERARKCWNNRGSKTGSRCFLNREPLPCDAVIRSACRRFQKKRHRRDWTQQGA